MVKLSKKQKDEIILKVAKRTVTKKDLIDQYGMTEAQARYWIGDNPLSPTAQATSIYTLLRNKEREEHEQQAYQTVKEHLESGRHDLESQNQQVNEQMASEQNYHKEEGQGLLQEAGELDKRELFAPSQAREEMKDEKDYCGNCYEQGEVTELKKNQQYCHKCGIKLEWEQ